MAVRCSRFPGNLAVFISGRSGMKKSGNHGSPGMNSLHTATATQSHRWSVVQSHTSPVWCRTSCHVDAAFKLHSSLLSHSSRWSSRHQNIPTQHNGNLAMLWWSGLLHIHLTMLPNVKNFWYRSGPKHTEVVLVVVPNVTSRSLWYQNGLDMYRNGLPRGPEYDKYRTWPNPLE